MDNKVEIDAIRTRRAKITDAAVAASQNPLFSRVTTCEIQNFPVFSAPESAPVAYVADMGDAKFYAHAPEDINFVLAAYDSLRVELEETQRGRDRFSVLITRQIAELTSLAARLAEKDATIEAGSLLLEAAREEIKHLQQMVEYKDGAFAGAVELAEIYKRERDENEKALTAAHSNALSEAIEKVEAKAVDWDAKAMSVGSNVEANRYFAYKHAAFVLTEVLEQLKQESSHANK